MAQSSRPQAGNILVNPTYVDSGPYNEDQWGARLFRKTFTTDQQATQGVLLGVDNELAVSFGTGTFNVYINTGAGFCNGHFFENTASVTIVVDAPAGGTRTDYVCMVENNTNAALPAGAATNYNTEGNASIPPYSCRLAVVKNGPANFSQAAALYMVRLATLNTQAGYIGAVTDNRVFCQYATDLQDNVVTTTKILNLAVTTAKIDNDAVTPAKIPDRTRRFFVQVNSAYNNTGGVYIEQGNTYLGTQTAAGNDSFLIGHFFTPDDFASGMTITVVTVPMNSGNVRSIASIYYGACGGAYPPPVDHTDSTALSQTALTANQTNCIKTITATNVAAGDIVHVVWSRYGSHPLDTVTDVYATGWIVEYTADS